jgi:hypothetical protein
MGLDNFGSFDLVCLVYHPGMVANPKSDTTYDTRVAGHGSESRTAGKDAGPSDYFPG